MSSAIKMSIFFFVYPRPVNGTCKTINKGKQLILIKLQMIKTVSKKKKRKNDKSVIFLYFKQIICPCASYASVTWHC